MGIVRRSAVPAVRLGAAAAAPEAGPPRCGWPPSRRRPRSCRQPGGGVRPHRAGAGHGGGRAARGRRLAGAPTGAGRRPRTPRRGPAAAPSSSLRASAVAADGSLVPGRRRFVHIRRRAWLRVEGPPYRRIAGRSFRGTGAVVPAAHLERVTIEGARAGERFPPLATVRVRGGRVDARFTQPAGGSAWSPPPARVVRAISEMRLYCHQRGQLVRVFPVVFGKPSTPTPLGTHRVYSKTAGPGAAFGRRCCGTTAAAASTEPTRSSCWPAPGATTLRAARATARRTSSGCGRACPSARRCRTASAGDGVIGCRETGER